MDKLTTGAAIIGGSSLLNTVQDCITDLAYHTLATSFHPASWAALVLAGVGYAMHHNAMKQTAPAAAG